MVSFPLYFTVLMVKIQFRTLGLEENPAKNSQITLKKTKKLTEVAVNATI
jgi:hypothetical protein